MQAEDQAHQHDDQARHHSECHGRQNTARDRMAPTNAVCVRIGGIVGALDLEPGN